MRPRPSWDEAVRKQLKQGPNPYHQAPGELVILASALLHDRLAPLRPFGRQVVCCRQELQTRLSFPDFNFEVTCV